MSTFNVGSVNGAQKMNGVERRVLGTRRRPDRAAADNEALALIRKALWELVGAILTHVDDGTAAGADLDAAERAARDALAALDGDRPDRDAVARFVRQVSDAAGSALDVAGAAVRVQRLLDT
jgi:hypothetical protein